MAVWILHLCVWLLNREEGKGTTEDDGGKDVILLEREDLGHWPYLEDPVAARAAMRRFFLMDDDDGRTGGGETDANRQKISKL